jgi:predicted negative regulator of RcsB-dependent stress response
MTTAYAQAVHLRTRAAQRFDAAMEQAKLSAQLRKIEADNEEFYQVAYALQVAKQHVDAEGFPNTARYIDKALEIIGKRILHVVSPREARELSTDGRLA